MDERFTLPTFDELRAFVIEITGDVPFPKEEASIEATYARHPTEVFQAAMRLCIDHCLDLALMAYEGEEDPRPFIGRARRLNEVSGLADAQR